jgi:hypothetical protein
MPAINIAPRNLETVLGVLERFVPGTDVRAFGQRVSGSARHHSDLELVIMTEQPLDAALLADIKAAFLASSLPFSVVALDWAALGDRDRRDIREEAVLIRKAVVPA